MKKLSFVLAAAGLMTLAACGETTPAENVAENVADVAANAEEAIENISDNAAAAIENVTDNVSAAADNAM